MTSRDQRTVILAEIGDVPEALELLKRLTEAVRVRPSAQALARLKELARASHAMAHTRNEKIEAEALSILIEMAEKVRAVSA